MSHSPPAPTPDERFEFEPGSDVGAKWVYLIGMWLFFGVGTIYWTGLIPALATTPQTSALETLAAAFISVFATVVLFVVTRRFVRLRAGRSHSPGDSHAR